MWSTRRHIWNCSPAPWRTANHFMHCCRRSMIKPLPAFWASHSASSSPRRTSTFIVSSVVAAAARRRSACGIAHILKVPDHRLVQRSREIT